MGQSVTRNTQRIFLFRFFWQRWGILGHFIALISYTRSKSSRERTRQRKFSHFSSILSRLNQLQCPETLIYGTTFPGTTKIHTTSPAECERPYKVESGDIDDSRFREKTSNRCTVYFKLLLHQINDIWNIQLQGVFQRALITFVLKQSYSFINVQICLLIPIFLY